jgi:KAP family P-loop domain
MCVLDSFSAWEKFDDTTAFGRATRWRTLEQMFFAARLNALEFACNRGAMCMNSSPGNDSESPWNHGIDSARSIPTNSNETEQALSGANPKRDQSSGNAFRRPGAAELGGTEPASTSRRPPLSKRGPSFSSSFGDDSSLVNPAAVPAMAAKGPRSIGIGAFENVELNASLTEEVVTGDRSSANVTPAAPVDTGAAPSTAALGYVLSRESTSTESVADKDGLDRGRLADALIDVLLSRNEEHPLAVALFGPWGAGKSSLIKIIEGRLPVGARPDKGARFIVSEFNAWKSERVDNIGAALAQQIVEALTSDLSYLGQVKLAFRLGQHRRARLRRAIAADVSSVTGKVRLWFATYLTPLALPFGALVCALAILKAMGHLSWFAAAASTAVAGAWTWFTAQITVYKSLLNWFKALAMDPKKKVEVLPSFTEKIGSFHEMSKTLEDLCALTLGDGNGMEGKRHLLLVVDDLDRCSPAAIKQVFDAVRLVAGISKVVVLVALDHRIAYAAVAKHYSDYGFDDMEVGQVAREYLAKVFNLSVALPASDAVTMERFIVSTLFDAPVGSALDRPDGKAETHGPEPTQGDPESSSRQVEALAFVSLAHRFELSNPRELWRLRQTWKLLKSIALGARATDVELSTLMTHLFLREVVARATSQRRARAERVFAGDESIVANAEDSLWSEALKEAWARVSDTFASQDALVRAVLLPAAPVKAKSDSTH